ncbi:protein takeout-like isoform X2 [Harmonia axyridis]|uniref:protein takeout-like isoform X2 n=1 Tax=Harmonia axyridis TaxID=115357 RepID=UPI001E279719|nr:protein takeout-like isoform X2 [Harmonia axyridis]
MKLFVLLVFLISEVHNLHLPEYIKGCPLDAPNFKECAIQNGNEALLQLVKGDASYKIPSFLPFRLPFVAVNFNGLTMNLTNASFSGTENLKLQDFTFDPVKKTTSMAFTGSMISYQFNYKAKGRIVAFPIEGQGYGSIKLYNATYLYSHNFEVKTKNKKHYMVIVKNNITLEPETVQVSFDGLFNGNKLLGDNLNKFLNENWREIMAEFRPIISDMNGLIANHMVKRIYEKIPLEEIYPGIAFDDKSR